MDEGATHAVYKLKRVYSSIQLKSLIKTINIYIIGSNVLTRNTNPN